MPVFGRRRGAGDRDAVGESAADLAAEAAADEAPGEDAAPGTGPWDVAEPHPDIQRVDLGSLQVPVLEGTDIQLVFAEQHGAWVTVRHGLSELQLQAFAAPKRSGIWDDVREEIIGEVQKSGGTSQEQEGPFGTELLARLNQPAEPGGRPVPQSLRFMGADGPRWFLRGLITGPAAQHEAAARPFEEIFADVVVVRGEHAEPPRKALDIALPEEARQVIEQQMEAEGMPNPFERGPEITEIH